MKTINLEEIFNTFTDKNGYGFKYIDYTSRKLLLKAMKEVCQQTLILASKNAKTMNDPYSYTGNTGSEYPADVIVNKQSILDTINQIE